MLFLLPNRIWSGSGLAFKVSAGGLPQSFLRSADLKHIDGQIFLQQRWIYSRSTENCSLGSASMVSHGQVPTQQGKDTLYRRERR